MKGTQAIHRWQGLSGKADYFDEKNTPDDHLSAAKKSKSWQFLPVEDRGKWKPRYEQFLKYDVDRPSTKAASGHNVRSSSATDMPPPGKDAENVQPDPEGQASGEPVNKSRYSTFQAVQTGRKNKAAVGEQLVAAIKALQGSDEDRDAKKRKVDALERAVLAQQDANKLKAEASERIAASLNHMADRVFSGFDRLSGAIEKLAERV